MTQQLPRTPAATSSHGDYVLQTHCSPRCDSHSVAVAQLQLQYFHMPCHVEQQLPRTPAATSSHVERN
jgi:hypothetical protein